MIFGRREKGESHLTWRRGKEPFSITLKYIHLISYGQFLKSVLKKLVNTLKPQTRVYKIFRESYFQLTQINHLFLNWVKFYKINIFTSLSYIFTCLIYLLIFAMCLYDENYHVRVRSTSYRLFLDKESLQETVNFVVAKVRQTKAEVPA